ncbi:type III pantothenate kinase [Colwellia sp. UCD-KL20]|uniref:type III pantothenate kinase n=1 Tax=Colwellia sp. UCD-KL20 TaxID=1917165 RepID=UPI0009709571|nr:type III pantothenate kinase [Colwellia sp. UCD-KL20]
MIIYVDIGNTRTKYLVDKSNTRIVIENSQITEQWLIENWGQANKVIIGSVKLGTLTDLINNWASLYSINVIFIESEKKRFGITNSYEQAKSLGVDRWLTLLGASIVFPKTGVVIIDAGTATTFDVLDEQGIHQGGWIFSGVDLLLSQLSNNTSKVKFEVTPVINTGFGKSTSECVNNAAWVATISMINSGIKKAEKAHNIKHCILLGGNAKQILPFIEYTKISVIDDLIFEGLKRYSI